MAPLLLSKIYCIMLLSMARNHLQVHGLVSLPKITGKGSIYFNTLAKYSIVLLIKKSD